MPWVYIWLNNSNPNMQNESSKQEPNVLQKKEIESNLEFK